MSFIPSLCSKPLTVAHRGARAHAPENTLYAADLAYNLGAQMWELDVCYTKDFELVVIHDDTLCRTTNVEDLFPDRESYKVCDFTLEEIRHLDAGSWFVKTDPFQTLASLDKERVENFQNLKVPTLKEALLLTKELNWFVNVEIKDHLPLIGHERVTKDVIDCIKECEMAERVLLSSFQHIYLYEAKKIMPTLPRGVLVEDNRPQNPLALCKEIKALAYHPSRELLLHEEIKALEEAGIYVNVWTVNDMAEAKTMLEAGVKGIITDFTKNCVDILAK